MSDLDVAVDCPQMSTYVLSFIDRLYDIVRFCNEKGIVRDGRDEGFFTRFYRKLESYEMQGI